MENNNFVEVMEHFDRMCKEYSSNCDINECPIAKLIDDWEKENNETWDESCIYFARECPYQFADAIMKWANTHPLPIYPTIGDVLRKICMLMNIDINTSIHTIYDERLTKEVADYFGIEPINKNKLV